MSIRDSTNQLSARGSKLKQQLGPASDHRQRCRRDSQSRGWDADIKTDASGLWMVSHGRRTSSIEFPAQYKATWRNGMRYALENWSALQSNADCVVHPIHGGTPLVRPYILSTTTSAPPTARNRPYLSLHSPCMYLYIGLNTRIASACGSHCTHKRDKIWSWLPDGMTRALTPHACETSSLTTSEINGTYFACSYNFYTHMCSDLTEHGAILVAGIRSPSNQYPLVMQTKDPGHGVGYTKRDLSGE